MKKKAQKTNTEQDILIIIQALKQLDSAKKHDIIATMIQLKGDCEK